MDSKYKPPPLVMNDVSNYQPAPAALAGQQQYINMVNLVMIDHAYDNYVAWPLIVIA